MPVTPRKSKTTIIVFAKSPGSISRPSASMEPALSPTPFQWNVQLLLSTVVRETWIPSLCILNRSVERLSPSTPESTKYTGPFTVSSTYKRSGVMSIHTYVLRTAAPSGPATTPCASSSARKIWVRSVRRDAETLYTHQRTGQRAGGRQSQQPAGSIEVHFGECKRLLQFPLQSPDHGISCTP